MAADFVPIVKGVIGDQRRPLMLWGVALCAIAAFYISFYPMMGGADLQAVVDNLPEGVVTALGYDRIGTAAGYLTSTVYGLLGPVLLLVFAIGNGARLVAGHEEDATLELELTSPLSRRRIYAERLLALTVDVVLLVAALTLAVIATVAALGLEVGTVEILAGSSGLALLVLAFGSLALGVGASTGRRAVALGSAAGVAVLAFVLDAVGPSIEAEWMTTVSPFSWFLANDPLQQGFDLGGLAALAALAVVSAVAGLWRFERRDLMV